MIAEYWARSAGSTGDQVSWVPPLREVAKGLTRHGGRVEGGFAARSLDVRVSRGGWHEPRSKVIGEMTVLLVK